MYSEAADVYGVYADGVTRRLLVGNAWFSDNERVVKPVQHQLKPVGKGKATVTVTNRGVSATILVTVKQDYKY